MELFEVKYKHSDLIPIAYRWVLKNAACGCAFKELNSIAGEYADVIGFGSGGHSVLVEVKVSRSDFLADKKKPFRKNPSMGMGSERYYCCPNGMIKPTELPEGWGLIYVTNGKAKLVHRPLVEYPFEAHGKTYYTKRNFKHEKNILAEHTLMYSALRRLHIKGHIECIYDKQYNYNHKD